jgi:hypothetical protein
MKKVLYWRVSPYNNGLVFAPPEIALKTHQIHEAISKAATWGQFKEMMPKDEYRKIIGLMGERPRPSAAFDSDVVPGFCEGDYPKWLQQNMELWLPVSILEQFAGASNSVINGSYWFIEEANADAICSALRGEGWTPIHMPDLRFH